MTNKPKWQRPKLIVLVRGRPEESVLIACKVDDFSHGPDGWAGEEGICGFAENLSCVERVPS